MKNINFKTLLPYLGAILIFLIITLAYFTPILEGKRILQSDIVQFQGMSKEIADYRAKTGEEPLWTNSMFSGMPAYQISVKYDSNLVGFLDKILTLGLPHPANLVFLYFVGFFILLLVMKVDLWLAVAGAIGFAFSSYFFIIIDAGHNSKAHAIAYMAPVIAGIILTMRRKYIWGGILTALALSLEVKANHPQITYYLALIAVLLGIFELVDSIRKKAFFPYLKAIGVLVIALVFAILTNLTTLWATYEYGKYTIRGKSELTSDKKNQTAGIDRDYATQWSYGIGETMTLLIPNFYGGASGGSLGKNSELAKVLRANNQSEEVVKQFTSQPIPPLYWGNQPGTAPVYIGAIIFFLFVLGLIVVKGPLKWWLLSATILSIMLAWGHNFMALTDFFLTYFPGYNKFRAVTMILVMAEFAMPLLGILAVKEMFDPEKDKKKLFRSLQIAFFITGGLCLLFALLPGMFLDFSSSRDSMYVQRYELPEWFVTAIRDDRKSLLVMDSFRSFVFILLTALVIWAVIYGKLKKQYAYFAFIVLLLADMFAIDKRYLSDTNFTTKRNVESPFQPSVADLQILQDKDPNFRVLNLTTDAFTDAGTSYYHKSIGGYHGAKLRRYQELIENQISKNNMAVMNMLNTKYFIIPDNNRAPAAQFNPNALGNAWFVSAVQVVENPDAELKALTGFKPDSVAVVDKRFTEELKAFTAGKDSLDMIKMDEYRPNFLSYHYSLKSNGLAVFSEIYYPKGWNAYVDGQLKPHFRANYVLRAMVLPAGNHKVEFKFEPAVYAIGEKISFISSILLIALVLFLAAFEFVKWRKTKA